MSTKTRPKKHVQAPIPVIPTKHKCREYSCQNEIEVGIYCDAHSHENVRCCVCSAMKTQPRSIYTRSSDFFCDSCQTLRNAVHTTPLANPELFLDSRHILKITTLITQRQRSGYYSGSEDQLQDKITTQKVVDYLPILKSFKKEEFTVDGYLNVDNPKLRLYQRHQDPVDLQVYNRKSTFEIVEVQIIYNIRDDAFSNP